MSKEAIVTDEIAAPIGPFSAAVNADGVVYCSGQIAQDSATGRLVEGDVTVQAEQIFKNLEALLRAADKALSDIAKVTIYLTDITDFPTVNAVYERQFEQPYPARTTIAVAALPLGASIEIDVIAK